MTKKTALKTIEQKALTTPADLLAMAVSQDADMDKLEKLMALQERWEANEARKAYVRAMSEFRAKCPTIDRSRTGHNSKYAGLAETLEAVNDLLSKCGLSHAWITKQEASMIVVTCCVTHTQGHKECTTMSAEPDTSGSKNSNQAIGSTLSYLERYTLYAILGLASREMDDDGGPPPDELALITKEQAADLNSLIEEVGANKEKFLKMCKIEGLEDMPAVKYENAVKRLEAKR